MRRSNRVLFPVLSSLRSYGANRGALLRSRLGCYTESPSIPAFRLSTSTPAVGTTHDVATEKRTWEDEIYRVLCEPSPSNASLVSLMESLLNGGERPSPYLVEAVADQLARSKDVRNSKAILSMMLESMRKASDESCSSTDVKAASMSQEEDPLELMFVGMIRTHCRRRDVPRALATLSEMEDATRRTASADAFLLVLEACATARPPLLRESQATWSQMKGRGVATAKGVRQDLFQAYMATFANSAGCAPADTEREEWRESMESKVDDVWGQLKAMVELSASVQDDETVSLARSSLLSFSSALAACVQDSGSGSSSAMTRSLESLGAFLQAAGEEVQDKEIYEIAEVLRGMARCGREDEVPGLLVEIRKAIPREGTELGTGLSGEMSFPKRLLRALGISSRTRVEHGARRSVGLALLKVVDYVSAEAKLYGLHRIADVESLQTARLQALLNVSGLLTYADAAEIIAAAQRAMEDAEQAASKLSAELGQEWQGPNSAALSLLALVRTRRGMRAGIIGGLDAIQEMYDRGMRVPANVAAEMESLVGRHGVAADKRRAHFLLSGRFAVARQGEKLYGRSGGRHGGGGLRANSNESIMSSSGRSIGDTLRALAEEAQSRRDGPNGGDSEHDEALAIAADEPSGAFEGDVSPRGHYQALRARRGSLSSAMMPRPGAIERACVESDGFVDPQAELVARISELSAKGKVLECLDELREVRGVSSWATRDESGAPESVEGSSGSDHGVQDGGSTSVVAVSYKVYSLILRAFRKGRDVRQEDEVRLAMSPLPAIDWLLRDMAWQGYHPDVMFLNQSLEAFAVAASMRQVRDGDEPVRMRISSEATEFMESMQDGWERVHPPVSPDGVSYNTLIKVLCRLELFDEAFGAYKAMEACGLRPDVITFNTLIHGLARAGDSETVWQVLLEMTNRSLVPDHITVDGVLNGHLENGDIPAAISFAQHAFNQYRCAPSPRKYCRVLEQAARLDDGKHEARRAVVVARQLWRDVKGEREGGNWHPVLGHPGIVKTLREEGIVDL